MKGAGVMGNFVERSKKALNAGCDLLLLCNEREGVIQVVDNLKLAKNQPHFMARQARLQSLFKRRVINWNDLISDQRWKLNYQKLADIQHRWLDIQAAKK
ncbi:beta-L-N-acetylhexosaminidase [Haemophilus influenzae HK1212]|uniref:Beta-L-N-acetylhexosaminidase n=1 Tax=Haemophilus influenzae HK1212 TaxID=456482 RepID=A0A7G2JWI6_HAEIF|nr:beta-L-N-acetylhexosaminidase [Haemophilus influenzae HK1212]